MLKLIENTWQERITVELKELEKWLFEGVQSKRFANELGLQALLKEKRCRFMFPHDGGKFYFIFCTEMFYNTVHDYLF